MRELVLQIGKYLISNKNEVSECRSSKRDFRHLDLRHFWPLTSDTWLRHQDRLQKVPEYRKFRHRCRNAQLCKQVQLLNFTKLLFAGQSEAEEKTNIKWCYWCWEESSELGIRELGNYETKNIINYNYNYTPKKIITITITFLIAF